MTRYFYLVRYYDGTDYFTLTIDVPAANETSAFIAAAGKAFALFSNTQYALKGVSFVTSSDSAPENDSSEEPAEQGEPGEPGENEGNSGVE